MKIRQTLFQRSVASIVLLTFSSLTLYPASVSAQIHYAAEKAGLLAHPSDKGLLGNTKPFFGKLTGQSGVNANTVPAVASVGPDEQFSQLLAGIHDELKALDTAATPAAPSMAKAANPMARNSSDISARSLKNTSPPAVSSIQTQKRIERVQLKIQALKQLYAGIEQSFSNTEQQLKAANMPAEILQRHQAAVAQYQSRQKQFQQLGEKVERSKGAEQQRALVELSRFMGTHQNAKPHQFTDPNKLPFGSPNNKVRKPNETKAEYLASLFPPKHNKFMIAGAASDGPKLAQASLPAQPVAEDTAETEDIQLTPAVKAKAQELNNNPVQIYNWVRNNISFIPSYGSIQGSELTLQNKRGNAFDTASLLIALYRAAGIPARYVYGTIDVPADKVMNWVGGVTKVEAAQSLLGQGGIPNSALTNAGKIVALRMEHVWVEAFVDYFPSRGAINKNPSTWVPMDASFKQYTFTKGMDIKGNVPLNSQDLLTQIQQGATVNEASGYVQNLNQNNLQTQLNAYQSRVKAYIDSQKNNATVGDVLGTQTIKTENSSILMGSLPYRIVTTANNFQTLPDNLRWRFKTNLYAADGISTGDDAMIELNQSTAKLAGKKITLSFIPATKADQDLINSYLPKAHADGSPIEPSELPKSLPGYLLHMKAEIRVDGQVVATTASSFTMGSTVKQQNQYFNPGTGTWRGGEDNDITVGEYDAIGLDLQGVGEQQLKTLQDRMTATNAKLIQYNQNLDDIAPLYGLTKEDVAGDIVYSGILGYFSQVNASDGLMALTLGNVKSYRLPSYGRFAISAQPHYFFGVVGNVSFPGVIMDVDYLVYNTAAKDDGQAAKVQFMRQAGAAASATEHAVPESMFPNTTLAANDPAKPQGISAVKALAIAIAQGQKIYTFNQSNQALHSTILQSMQISADVKLEIVNALAAGKEVTVHEKDISVNGWKGNGYVVLDPATGAGAYKIAGGTNGGAFEGLKYIIKTLNYFYDSLAAVAAFMKTPVPLLETVVRFIQIAKLAHDILDKGLKCNNVSAIIIFLAISTILSILMVELTMMIANPLAALAVGFTLDWAFDWLLDQSPQCAKG